MNTSQLLIYTNELVLKRFCNLMASDDSLKNPKSDIMIIQTNPSLLDNALIKQK